MVAGNNTFVSYYLQKLANYLLFGDLKQTNKFKKFI
jgi:hypothetical protein